MFQSASRCPLGRALAVQLEALGRRTLLFMDRASRRVAFGLTGAYLLIVGLIFGSYVVDAHRRGNGEGADVYGPMLLALGLPWSWPSLHVESAGLALCILFGSLLLNAALIFAVGKWIGQRSHRDRPT